MSWIEISQAIGGIATAVALFFIGFQSIETRKQTSLTERQIQQTQKEMILAETGFLKLGLECSSESRGEENYVISKTLLENTSRRPIIVKDAFLLSKIFGNTIANSISQAILINNGSSGNTFFDTIDL